MDTFSKAERSRIMSLVRSTGTGPEMKVRDAIRLLGYRCRVHVRNLAGTPDLVFTKQRKIIFVHGCFWHAHHCQGGRKPKANAAYWNAKLARNVARDKRDVRKLRTFGWRVLVIWECQTKDVDRLGVRLLRFLGK
jgi:DNA mismatch endonuclease, patch repair protein